MNKKILMSKKCSLTSVEHIDLGGRLSPQNQPFWLGGAPQFKMIFSNFFLYHVIPHPLKLLSANARNFIFILADLVDVTL